MLVRWSPPLRQLPACTAGRAGSSAGEVSLPVQLLLRSRRLQEEGDAAIGPFSRQNGLPGCRGDLDQRQAARSNAAPGPRACEAVWCGPGDRRAMAGLLARWSTITRRGCIVTA